MRGRLDEGRKSDLHDFTLQLHGRSERAILVSEAGDKDKAVWLPLAQIEAVPGKRGLVTVTVPEWLALEKGLL